MLGRGLILAALLSIGGFQTARAEPACDTIGAVMETASLIRKIQADKSHQNDPENFARLDVLAGQISLPALVPMSSTDTLTNETTAIRAYLSNIREAIAGSNSGYEEYARETLVNGLTADLSTSLQAFDQHWNCGPEDAAIEAAGDLPLDAELGAGSRAEPEDKGENEPTNLSAKNPGSGSGTGSSSGGNSDGIGFARGAIINGSTALFTLITIGIGLIFVIFYARRFIKTRNIREDRRPLHKSVQVLFEDQEAEMFIVDISMNGFKLKHSGLVLHEGRLQVELDGVWHSGQVRWQNDFFAGVKFNKPIDGETLNAVIA